DPDPAGKLGLELQQLLAATPPYVPALFISALDKQKKSQLEAATQLYKQILALYPSFVPATRNLGLLYFTQGQDDQNASELLAKARETFPEDQDVARALGILTYRKG